MGRKKPVVYCPECGGKARRSETSYGYRHECCGLHSWGSKPLVSKEVHALRQRFHAAFDPIWKRRIMSRGEAYSELARLTGFQESECHGARQECPRKLLTLIQSADDIRNGTT